MPKQKPMKGISRIDQPEKHNRGYYVRLKRRSKVRSAFFADKTHGGPKAALLAAREHYRKLLREFGPARKPLRFPWLEEAVGGKLRPNPAPPHLALPQLSWVRARGFRCLAYRDELYRWVNFYTGRLLSDPVQVIDPGGLEC